MIIPIPEFAPDQPDVPSSTSDAVFNVVPASAQSYGPMPSHLPFSTALDARCQGAISVADNAGNVSVHAGDMTKLYRLNASSTTPADVSKVGGYSTPSNGWWHYAQFGNRVIATNSNDAPQSYIEGSSTKFADLISTGVTSLKATYVAAVRDFIVFGKTTDDTFGNCPQRVWWTAINDPTNVPTPGTIAAANAMSDFQDNVGTHGALKGIAGNLGTSDAGLFYERAVYRMVWAGEPYIFDFFPAEGARGLLCDGGLTQYGPIAYYTGEDGFYAFDGSSSRPLGKGKVDKFFHDDLLPSYVNRVCSTVDPKRGLVMWAYPGIGAIDGIPNRLLLYSPYFDKFTATELGAQQISSLVRGATFNKTLEQLDAIGSLDSLPFTMDSDVYAGGRAVMAGFDVDNKFGYFDGANLAPRIETADFEPIAGYTSLLTRARPLADSVNVTVSAAARTRIQDAVTYNAPSLLETDGTVSLRSLGKYHRLKTEIPAGDTWNHISGIDIEEVSNMGGR